MVSFYRFKRLGFYSCLLTVPFLVFLILFFTMGLKRLYLGEGVYITTLDPINTLICAIASFAVGIVIIFMGGWLLRHPLLSMLEGKGLIAWILDSTGLIGIFNVVVNAPSMIGKKPGLKDVDITETYDTDIMHRVIFPKAAPLCQGIEVSKDAIGRVVFKEKMVLVLPDEEKRHDTLFKFESVPCFIYNKVLGQFLSRDVLAKNEKDMQLKHSALNILQKIVSIGDQFRDFGRYAGELTRPKPSGLFARMPWLKWVLIGVVILVVIMIILMFVLPSTGGGGSSNPIIPVNP